MGDPPKSPTPNFYSVLGISKTASLADIGKAYKSLVMKWHPDRNPTNKDEAESKFRSINEAYRELSLKKREEAIAGSQNKTKKKKSDDEELHISSPTLLSRTTSRISPMPSPGDLSQNTSTSMDFYASLPKSPTGPSNLSAPTTPKEVNSLSKMTSRRNAMPIIFSQSTARRKPQPIEKKLKCTLEELCLGCVKKIKITRKVISNTGLIVEEEEILMIKVKPGWKKGTKITFEGKGDERPGTLPADIIFAIDEKEHPLFKREGDDLELGIEVPLVQALTGCTISVPLLGGGDMTLSIDDIIYPGYEKLIPGQGMPKSKEDGRRGDLCLKFLVELPTELSDEQRIEVVNILRECF
ncbi:dnaJ homolog 1-like [Olea europaea subsp. europaea]|uniref:DnaJ homolog 1-like n=1 Tax=Olea europaea subsp. europaea TaxID=158383 RepID=A0A8S0RAP2_OLEEU|nr:dnaJ homolog 1-like [Olea europaea subsp. europaea]